MPSGSSPTCTFQPAVSPAVQEHPRLFADANDFAALSVRLDRAELGRLARAHLLREAEELLEAPPLVCRKDECGKRILLISRAAIDRIAKLSMAAHAYESDNPGVRQLFFTRAVPTSGQLTLSVSFMR